MLFNYFTYYHVKNPLENLSGGFSICISSHNISTTSSSQWLSSLHHCKHPFQWLHPGVCGPLTAPSEIIKWPISFSNHINVFPALLIYSQNTSSATTSLSPKCQLSTSLLFHLLSLHLRFHGSASQTLSACYVKFPFSTVLPSHLRSNPQAWKRWGYCSKQDRQVSAPTELTAIKENMNKQLVIRSQDKAGKPGRIRCYANWAVRPKKDLCIRPKKMNCSRKVPDWPDSGWQSQFSLQASQTILLCIPGQFFLTLSTVTKLFHSPAVLFL